MEVLLSFFAFSVVLSGAIGACGLDVAGNVVEELPLASALVSMVKEEKAIVLE